VTWPQVVVGLAVLFQAFVGTKAMVTDRELSPGALTVTLFLLYAIIGGFCYTLHAGDFW
jgi:hypothetical protein